MCALCWIIAYMIFCLMLKQLKRLRKQISRGRKILRKTDLTSIPRHKQSDTSTAVSKAPNQILELSMHRWKIWLPTLHFVWVVFGLFYSRPCLSILDIVFEKDQTCNHLLIQRKCSHNWNMNQKHLCNRL